MQSVGIFFKDLFFYSHVFVILCVDKFTWVCVPGEAGREHQILKAELTGHYEPPDMDAKNWI